MSIPYIIFPENSLQASYAWDSYLFKHFRKEAYPILSLLNHNLDFWKDLHDFELSRFETIIQHLDMLNNEALPMLVRTLCECTDMHNESNTKFLHSAIRSFSNAESFQFLFGVCEHDELATHFSSNSTVFDFYIKLFEFEAYNSITLISYYLQDCYINVDCEILNALFENSYNLRTLVNIFSESNQISSSLWTNHLEQFLMTTPQIDTIFKRMYSLDLPEQTKILFFMANAEIILADENYSPEAVMSNDAERYIKYEEDKKSRYLEILTLFTEFYPKIANLYISLKSMGVTEFAQFGSLVHLNNIKQDSGIELPFIY